MVGEVESEITSQKTLVCVREVANKSVGARRLTRYYSTNVICVFAM